MKMLALEFSSPKRSFAFASAQLGEFSLIASGADLEVRQGIGPLEPIARKLGEFSGLRDEIECVAVGIGPGSYTGIRMSIAIAQGWQLAHDVKTIGISSADCLAEQARNARVAERVHFVVDAQRGEFYLATYDLSERGFVETGKLRLVAMEEVVKVVAVGGKIVGPEVDRWFPGGMVMLPEAATVAKLAATRDDFIPANRLEPIYLRETTFVKAPLPRNLP